MFSQKNQVMHLKFREKITERHPIPEVINVEEKDKETEKTQKILTEIEMILKVKKRLVE